MLVAIMLPLPLIGGARAERAWERRKHNTSLPAAAWDVSGVQNRESLLAETRRRQRAPPLKINAI